MSPQLHFLISVAALCVSVAALGFSVMNAFPGLKTALAVFRDGVLWLALFFVLGGVSFIVWQRFQHLSAANESSARLEHLPTFETDFTRR
jgi:hypothetical protein